jgi:hypothetical protein
MVQVGMSSNRSSRQCEELAISLQNVYEAVYVEEPYHSTWIKDGVREESERR